MKTMLELLKEHLASTTKMQRQAMWGEIFNMNLQGPSLSEFYYESHHHELKNEDFIKIKSDTKMAPDYLESFFFIPLY